MAARIPTGAVHVGHRPSRHASRGVAGGDHVAAAVIHGDTEADGGTRHANKLATKERRVVGGPHAVIPFPPRRGGGGCALGLSSGGGGSRFEPALGVGCAGGRAW